MFNGFLYPAKAQEASLRTQAAQERLRDLRDRISRDVRTGWLNATTAYDRLAVTQQLLDQANLALVNLPSMKPEAVRELGKYIWLAEAMGSIACELSNGQVSQLEVVAKGNLAAKEISPLVVSALRGVKQANQRYYLCKRSHSSQKSWYPNTQ